MIHLQPKLMAALREPGVPPVLAALRDALRLEFATIPPYLYAYYSLDRQKNREIASTLRSVFVEEMLHMTLVCNIINALGGTPKMNDPDFIPNYPGPLPGSVESDLVVHLAPYSAVQLAMFLKIEEPEKPLVFPDRLAAVVGSPVTIGQFYAAIKQRIAAVSATDFANPPRNQVGPDIVDNAIIVTNKTTAMAAIDLIVQQGEGTATSPNESGNGMTLAHFYRFNQIAKGRHLVANPAAGPDTPPDQRFIYNGKPIVFDPTGVYPAPSDPKTATYPAGSAARQAMDAFNGLYVDLLKSLDQGFNGTPAVLTPAIGDQMTGLGQAARNLMHPLNGGVSLGPSFEYFSGS